ncbi:MAG: coiled-coil domain-containing protein [Planctomycetota bacterium]
MHDAVQEIHDILSGRPGGVNRFLRRWGKLVIDYSTALTPDRTEPFGKLLEDIFVDAVSQCRAAARAKTEEEVQAFLIESALRTVRSRYRELLDTKAAPDKATTTLSFQEIVDRSKETEETLRDGISSGRIRAVRADNEMRVDAEDIPELQGRRAALAFHVSAAERELLCLHFRFKYSPDEIAQWSDRSAASLESLINTASDHLSARIEAKRSQSATPQDTEMRRYIEGRLSSTDTAKFEQKVLKDKVAHERINELRSESDHIRDLFRTAPYDLSRVAVNVRDRNPHRTLIIPPSVALWVQIAALVAIILVLHSVGAYIAPPVVEVRSVTGNVSVDGGRTLESLHNGKLVIGQSLTTKVGAQALIVLDESNSIRMAEETSIKLREPRKQTRQVVDISQGEIWGKFVGSGYAFSIGFEPTEDRRFELTGDQGAEFDLAVGEMAKHVLPDNMPQDAKSVPPSAVLRVFRGVVLTGQVDEEYQHIGQDQWVVYYEDGKSFSGRRGDEDFRSLRYENGSRYKDRLHWLNSKTYPLSSQNSLLSLDRKLRDLASVLEDFRSTEVVREGVNEIKVFREQIKKVIADADSRVAAGNGRDRAPETAALGDAELIAAREQILGDISFWLKQASSGAYPTLGDAAKTMIHPINKDKERMTTLDDRIGDAVVRQSQIKALDEIIQSITETIDKLKKDKLSDPDGTKRASLQTQIDEQNKLIRAGREAKGRTEVLTVRLNGYDNKIDNKRRQLPPLRKEESDLQASVGALEKAIADNRYTPELLASTRTKLNETKLQLEAEIKALETVKAEISSLEDVVAKSEGSRLSAQIAYDTSAETRESATAALEASTALKENAQQESDDAKAALVDLQKQLDELPENDSRRNQLEKQIVKASQHAKDKGQVLSDAEVELNLAKAADEQAAQALTDAETSLNSAKDRLTKAKSNLATGESAHDDANADIAITRSNVSNLTDEIKSLETLKDNLAADKVSLTSDQQKLTEKQSAIATLESEAEALESKAAPHRAKLKEELAIVDAGKDAEKALTKIQAEKDRYDAHSEDVTRRQTALNKEFEKRKQLAESELIRTYEQTVSDFNALARRVDAMEWLRHRALAEDVSFGHKQVAARDIYKERVADAEKEAISLLDPLCIGYRNYKLNDDIDQAKVKRNKLLSTLWRLYYSSEELTDATGVTCYYVAVQSGANVETFNAIDLKWKEALSLVLGKEKFEGVTGLESTDLQTATDSEE